MPLQKQFRGIHDYTGDFDLGQHVFNLGNVVTPVVQIDDFMETPRWVENSVDLDTLAAGIPWPIATVPAAEAWRVHAIGASTSSIMPIQGLRFRFSLFLPSGATTIGLDGTPSSTLESEQSQHICRGLTFPNNGLWCEAGCSLGIMLTAKPAGTYPNIFAALQYTRIGV